MGSVAYGQVITLFEDMMRGFFDTDLHRHSLTHFFIHFVVSSRKVKIATKAIINPPGFLNSIGKAYY